MSIIPNDLRYTTTHEWVYLAEDGIVTLGITDFAQNEIGDIIYIDLPIDEESVIQGLPFGTVESVEHSAFLIAPFNGAIVEVNPDIESNPGLINLSPYEQGWIVRIKPDRLKEYDQLLDANGYRKLF